MSPLVHPFVVRALIVIACCLVPVAACSGDDNLERVIEPFGDSHWYGTRKNGKKHGQWVKIGPQGQRWRAESWRNGIQHGLSLSWWEDGMLASDSRWVRGALHGRSRGFWGEEGIAELGWRHRGRPIGLWCEWDLDGRLEKLTEYFDGHVVREQAYPPGPCPLTQGHGRRHLDPNNTDYD